MIQIALQRVFILCPSIVAKQIFSSLRHKIGSLGLGFLKENLSSCIADNRYVAAQHFLKYLAFLAINFMRY